MSLARRLLLAPAVVEDAAATAYFAACTTKPSAPRKALINNLIIGLKADGLWLKIDWLLLLASEDWASTKQASRVNVRNPAKVAVESGPVTYTAMGVNGTGTGGYLDTVELPSAAGNVYALDSAFFMSYANGGTGTLNEPDMATGQLSFLNTSAVGQAETSRINTNLGSASYTSTALKGGRIVSRTGATSTSVYKNGALVTTSAVSSYLVPTFSLYVLSNQASTFSKNQLGMIASGGGLTATEAANLHTRTLTFLTAIGAN